MIPALKSGFFGQRSYTMIVTDQRLILAELTNELMKKEHQKNMRRSEEEGKGFLRKLKSSMSSSFKFHHRYHDMDPVKILNENPNNYEIRLSDIKSTKLRTGAYHPDSGKAPTHKMIIKWNGGKEKFTFERMEPKQVQEILIQVLGSKAR
ncbi:MAG: hypothetical protein ACOC87_00525 [Candidatus Natronoplasma sp.]